MSRSKKLIAVGLAALFSVSSAGVAQAYPAGTDPSLGLSSYSRLTPGEDVTVSARRIYKGCEVNIGWDGGNHVSATAGKTGRTAPVNVASPSIGGKYVLRATFGAGCRSDQGLSVFKNITVGRLVRHTVAIKSSTSSARRNPTLTLTGKIFWASESQPGLTVNLVLTKPDMTTVNLTAVTNANGVYTATYGGVGAVAQGKYTVVTTLSPDGTYAGSIATSRTVTIRR